MYCERELTEKLDFFDGFLNVFFFLLIGVLLWILGWLLSLKVFEIFRFCLGFFNVN